MSLRSSGSSDKRNVAIPIIYLHNFLCTLCRIHKTAVTGSDLTLGGSQGAKAPTAKCTLHNTIVGERWPPTDLVRLYGSGEINLLWDWVELSIAAKIIKSAQESQSQYIQSSNPGGERGRFPRPQAVHSNHQSPHHTAINIAWKLFRGLFQGFSHTATS